ncbi:MULTISPECIES: ribonuclease E inhibitor RraB [Corallincola]|uniref:Regulator of ribonuclease activity B n=3 Tax=Corallincola TaxID=1775176 RepID=A0A368NMF0_9GAMM|nr:MULTISPECIES: ribonuclease E inhibitor RraB [Corallincola]RCU51762.1 ribonuclease E inhibitor RraB [Corallincola holothuriorum]TAA47251.1 ribonuclease E inhibitor RraB [Corallincola spongiicola]TCI04914.1 ribonuclease E inhibitor RraB [Corallincola luteus]
MTELEQEIAEQLEINRETVEALLEDGSQPDAEYTFEHHFASDDFDQLEKLVLDAFKQGFEVTDAEELEMEDGELLLCCDVIAKGPLNIEKIDKQTNEMFAFAEKHDVHYDGWGTYFIE